MPIVRVDVYRGFDAPYKKAVLDGIHAALVEAFRIPDHDRNQIIREHADEDFERSASKSRQFTLVEIVAFKGRSREAKRLLYQAIVRNLSQNPGIAPRDVLITINEPELVNWGVQGGQCADEADLGFKIQV